MTLRRLRWQVPICALVLAWSLGEVPLGAAELDRAQADFFEKKIRPILVEHCQRCHGAQKQSGNLRLDSRAALLAGGDSGPAVVPGQPDKSLLIEAVNYASLQMPPTGRLKPPQVELLTEWVKMGVPWPASEDTVLLPRRGSLVVTEADRQHWSFVPPRRPAVPSFSETARPPTTAGSVAAEEGASTPLDLFVRRALWERGLDFSPPATRPELIRRLSFDLIGLPPTAEEVEAFVADERPDAYERLVDRLLAAPQFGERWARHWLDIVRFAQTNGYERDSEKPLAWQYRDYVIRAFNRDKPYDRFLLEQLAGDELEPPDDDALIATAYYRLGVWDDEPDDGKQAKADELDDIVSTTGSAMLGLTLGCARCHDHKFDPLSQEDYYSFTAFFQNIHLYGKVADVVAGGQPVDKEGIFRPLPSGQGETLAVRERETPPPPTFVLIRGNAHTPGKEVRPRFLEVLCPSSEAMWPALPELRDAAAASDRGHGEGSAPSGGGEAGADVAGCGLASVRRSHGRRLALARWITDPQHPLTGRVIVNRLWQHHFGRGLVATPSDFGRTGAAPSHPELLDWLACELVEGGWELKRLHRLIVSSTVYRQSSRMRGASVSERPSGVGTSPGGDVASAQVGASGPVDPQQIDPDNTLLWRQNLRRLEAEAIRDAVLAASGELNLAMGGRGVFPTLPPEVLAKQSRPGSGWDRSPPAEQARRSVYIFVKRTLGVPLLEALDAASPDTPVAQRSVTTVAPQALILLNSQFMAEQAAAMARRVVRQAGNAPREQVQVAYRLALARAPTAEEASLAEGFLTRQTARWATEVPSPGRPREGPVAAWELPGWRTYEGQWQPQEGGGGQVQRHPGAKIVREGLTLGDGVVEGQVQLLEGRGDAGLLVRVSHAASGVNTLKAYNINLKAGMLRLGKHQNDWHELVAVPAPVAVGRWHTLRVALEGGRIRVWLDEAPEPQIDYTDPAPLAPGSVGFRTYQVSAAVRQLRLVQGDVVQTLPLEFAPPATKLDDLADESPSVRALADLCKLLMNLNEFVYVD
jgi:cytochrome c553